MTFVFALVAFATAGVALASEGLVGQVMRAPTATVLGAVRVERAARASDAAGALPSRCRCPRQRGVRDQGACRAPSRHALPFGTASRRIAYLKREGVHGTGPMPGCSTRGPRWPTNAPSPSGARKTGIISGSWSRRKTRPSSADLRTFTRELMADVERDLGTRLDWVDRSLEHRQSARPCPDPRQGPGRGRSRVSAGAYISRGFRDRAAERVTLELGRDKLVRTVEREVDAERWTGLDRALRPSPPTRAPAWRTFGQMRAGRRLSLRRLMVGRAAERLRSCRSSCTGCWTLKPLQFEDKLRDLSIRGDAVETIRQRSVSKPGSRAFLARRGTDRPRAPP